jgi:hypothetical protein
LQVCPRVETQSGPSQQSASTARRFISHASPPNPAAKGDMAEEVKAAADERKKQEALTSSLAKQLTRVSTRVRAEGKARATMMAPADAPGCEAHFVLFQWILTAAAQVGHLRAIRSWR